MLHYLILPVIVATVQSNNIKYQLANKQGLRCKSCKNPISLQDLESYKLSYDTPLEFGGQNDLTKFKNNVPHMFPIQK